MVVFETILGMLAGAVLLLEASRCWRLPYPALLALAGAAVAISPLKLKLEFDPELVLALFVAPVLLDAAYDTSLRDLKRNWGAVASLAVIAVGLTTLAVAWLVHRMAPGMPWAAALAAGAIVAPPDAVATTSVLREVKLPHRLAVILNGETLLNDAAALLIYKLAVAGVLAGGSIGTEVVAPVFALSLIGSVVAGPALAWLVSWVTGRIDNAPASIVVQFVATFGVWIIAERVGLSPILTMVIYAMTLARSGPARMPARLRVPSYAVWETAVLVLNAFAFMLIGLELGPVIAAARPGQLQNWIRVGAAVLGAVIAVRMLWAMGAALWVRGRIRRRGAVAMRDGPIPNWRTGLIVGWAGTRGIVTIATALALPPEFPQRGMLLLAAFAVTLGTLLIQGMTLRPLVQALHLPEDELVEGEMREARRAIILAARAALESEQGAEVERLRGELDAELEGAALPEKSTPRREPPAAALRIKALSARRARLIAMRDEGIIGDDAFHQIEEQLDLAELGLSARL